MNARNLNARNCRCNWLSVFTTSKLTLVALIAAIGFASPADAAMIDLTAGDVLFSPTAATGGIFKVWHAATAAGAGIGSNDKFLELTTGSSGTEQGYNTDGVVQFDTTKDPGAKALLLSVVPQVVIDGVTYFEFALGLNATGGDRLHSLDEFQIFQSDSNTLVGYDAGAGATTTPFGNESNDDTLSGLAPVFDWFGDDSDDYALLQDDVSGQSNFDYLFFVPQSAIDMTKAYVYLYAELGYNDDVDDGEERWSVDLDDPPYCDDVPGLDCHEVPEPSTVSLLVMGLACLVFRLRSASSHI